MGKTIRVTPEELGAAAKKMFDHSTTYRKIYALLMQDAETMGSAWEGDDNRAFVEQIRGFCQKLEDMAKKLELAGTALKQQQENYAKRQQANIEQVKKLPN